MGSPKWDTTLTASEADSDGECETCEGPVKNFTWNDAGSSDESPINFCSLNLNMSIFYT